MTTVASLRSSLKMSFFSKVTSFWTSLFSFALFASPSLMRSGSMSKPTALHLYFFAAVMTMRPSPQPRS